MRGCFARAASRRPSMRRRSPTSRTDMLSAARRVEIEPDESPGEAQGPRCQVDSEVAAGKRASGFGYPSEPD